MTISSGVGKDYRRVLRIISIVGGVPILLGLLCFAGGDEYIAVGFILIFGGVLGATIAFIRSGAVGAARQVPLITATPAGVQTRHGFAVTWPEVLSLSTSRSRKIYNRKGEATTGTVISDNFVFTLRHRDPLGRNVRRGFSLGAAHTGDVGAFTHYVRSVAPHVVIGEVPLGTSAVPSERSQPTVPLPVPEPDGRYRVDHGRFRPGIGVDAQGLHLPEQSVPWSIIDNLQIVTDTMTTRGDLGIDQGTHRTHTLVVATKGSPAAAIRHSLTRSSMVDQLIVTVAHVAPTIRIYDLRDLSDREQRGQD